MKPSPSIDKAYVTLQSASGIKVGNKVKVLRTAVAGEMGWDNTWPYEMNELVGKVGKVVKINGGEGIAVEFDADDDMDSNYDFPFFVLEKIVVTEATITKTPMPGLTYTIKITKNEAVITGPGGSSVITLTKSTLDEIVQRQATLD